jgi:flagellar biosynthesis regulator FlaF
MEDYTVLTDVCINENIFWYNFVMDVSLMGNQLFKVINCVILSVGILKYTVEIM